MNNVPTIGLQFQTLAGMKQKGKKRKRNNKKGSFLSGTRIVVDDKDLFVDLKVLRGNQSFAKAEIGENSPSQDAQKEDDISVEGSSREEILGKGEGVRILEKEHDIFGRTS